MPAAVRQFTLHWTNGQSRRILSTIVELTEEQLELLEKATPGMMALYRIRKDRVETYYASPELPALNGMSSSEYAELTGRDASSIVVSSDLHDLMAAVQDCIKTGKPLRHFYRVKHKTRGFDWVHANARLCGTYKGDPILLTVFANAAVESEIYQTLLDNSKTLIYVCDTKSFEILYANRIARQSFGRQILDNPQGKCYELIGGRSAPCVHCLMNTGKNAEGRSIERYNEMAKKWEKAVGQHIEWCGHSAFVQYIDDISEEKAIHKQIEDSERRYEIAVEGAELGVWEYHIKTRQIVSPSHSFVRFNVPDVIENVPESILPLFPKSGQQKLLTMFKKMEEGIPRITEDFWMNWTPDMAPRCERVTYSVVKDAEGRPDIAYGIGQNITAAKRAELAYRQTVDDMLILNSRALCAFRLNLTQNTVCDQNTSSDYIAQQYKSGTVDGLFACIRDTIKVPEDRQHFESLFNRESLLRGYAKGRTHYELSYQRIAEKKASIWVITTLTVMNNPLTDNIEAVLYTVDNQAAMDEACIIRQITGREYDFIALISPDSGFLKFYAQNSRMTRADCTSGQYLDEDQTAALKAHVDTANFDELLHQLSLSTIVHELQSRESYEVFYSIRDHEGNPAKKLISFCWLDETKQQILAIRSDITQAFMSERENMMEMQNALTGAEKANRMKSEFLSNVSHDMRTPLNGIMGYIDLASNETEMGRIRGYLDKALESSRILLQLVNDTLDLSRLESGRIILHEEPVSSCSLISRIASTVQPSMDQKHIRFDVVFNQADDIPILTDIKYVNEIFINLLSNAVKYTPEGGHIEFIIERTGIGAAWADFKSIVRDNGVGISREFLPKIYEPFSQERTKATAGIGGSGLGLSIVKKLITTMNGRIEAQSELGRGTEFAVFTRFKRADAAAVKEERRLGESDLLGPAAFDLKGKKALLCEDNQMNSEIAKIILQRKGMAIDCAVNGQEGVKLFAASKQGEYAAVLMDLRMPVMNGFDAARAIRACGHPDARTIPIVALSADAYPEDIRKSLEAGMNSHLAKPIDPDLLCTELAHIVLQS